MRWKVGSHGCDSMERCTASVTYRCLASVDTSSPHTSSWDTQMKENPARCSARFWSLTVAEASPVWSVCLLVIHRWRLDGRLRRATCARSCPNRRWWMNNDCTVTRRGAEPTCTRSVISRPYHSPVAPAGSGRLMGAVVMRTRLSGGLDGRWTKGFFTVRLYVMQRTI